MENKLKKDRIMIKSKTSSRWAMEPANSSAVKENGKSLQLSAREQIVLNRVC